MVRWRGRRARSIRFAPALVLLASVLSAPSARAGDKQRCIEASEKAQQLKNAGKLSEARSELAVCGSDQCPRLIQHDCAEWMREVIAISPSIVPGAKDRQGRDVIDVKVQIDGKPVTGTLDGKAIEIDPGVHLVRFEKAGVPPIDERIVVRQGEKNRIVTATFEAPVESRTRENPSSSFPIAAAVVGGLSLVTLGAALVIDLGAMSDARTLRGTCAPTCDPARVDDIDTRYHVALGTAIGGGVLAIAAVALFVVHGSPALRMSEGVGARIVPRTVALSASGLGVSF